MTAPFKRSKEPRILTHTLVAAPVGGSVAVTYLSWKGESMILSSDLHKIILPFVTARKISLAPAPTARLNIRSSAAFATKRPAARRTCGQRHGGTCRGAGLAKYPGIVRGFLPTAVSGFLPPTAALSARARAVRRTRVAASAAQLALDAGFS